MSDNIEHLKMQYEEGARIIRHYIDCRYKLLQFIAAYNAAVLGVGFSQNSFFLFSGSLSGVVFSVLSFFIAFMGLATEFSTTSYNTAYFNALKGIERLLGNIQESQRSIPDGGVILHSTEAIKPSLFHKYFPVHRTHKLFYIILMIFWIVFAGWHIKKM